MRERRTIERRGRERGEQRTHLTPGFLFPSKLGPFAKATLVSSTKRPLTGRANQGTLGLARNKVRCTNKSAHNTVTARKLGADVKLAPWLKRKHRRRGLTTVDQT